MWRLGRHLPSFSRIHELLGSRQIRNISTSSSNLKSGTNNSDCSENNEESIWKKKALDDYVKMSWYKFCDPNLPLPYQEFDIVLRDINEEKLKEIGCLREIEHLSPGTFSSPAFPVNGWIYGLNLRYMIPLVCQRAGEPNSKAVNVWFLVDTGCQYTCLSEKTLEAFLGPGNATGSLYFISIQEQGHFIECRKSKDHFKFANILGADAMRNLQLSIAVDWKTNKFKLIQQ